VWDAFPSSLQEREAAHRQPCKKVVHIRAGVLAGAEHGRWRAAEAIAVKLGIHVGRLMVGQGGGAIPINLDVKRLSAPAGWGLFQIVHIIEQHPQAGASGIEVRRRVIGWEQHERLEKPEHRCLTGIGQLRKRIPRPSRLSTVAQNYFRGAGADRANPIWENAELLKQVSTDIQPLIACYTAIGFKELLAMLVPRRSAPALGLEGIERAWRWG
jgi:hypothetical protein